MSCYIWNKPLYFFYFVIIFKDVLKELFGEYILKEMISNVKTKKKKLETSDLCTIILKATNEISIKTGDVIKKNKKLYEDYFHIENSQKFRKRSEFFELHLVKFYF